mgnify:CR=1 FL=1
MDSNDSGPDDLLSWDGRKTADFAKVSNDGLWAWDGSDWLPRKTTKKQTSQNNQEQGTDVRPDSVQIPKFPGQSEEAVNQAPSMDIGTISPEGYHQWDGEKWLSVELGKVSGDGCWIWDGKMWVANRGVRPHTTVEETDPISEESSVEQTPFMQNHEMIIIQSNSKKSGIFTKLSLATVIVIAIVAITVVLAGVLSSILADDSVYSENNRAVEGTWYNIEDTVTFYPDGTVSESTGSVKNWKVDGDNLTLTSQFDEETFDVIFRYDIVYDSEGDSLLLIALYEYENQSQTNVVNESSCFGYSDSILGSEPGHIEERKLIYPTWCNPEEK